MVRYDGLLAPRASWRDEVVPATCVTVGTGESRVNSGSVPAPVTHSAIAEASGDISAGTPIEGTNSDTNPAESHVQRLPWAQLLARVLELIPDYT